MRTVTYRLADLSRAVIPLGFVGENQHTRVIFDAAKVFAEYPAAVPALTVQPPQGTSYPAVVVRDGDYVQFDVSDSDLIHAGTGELQLAFVQDAVKVRTFIARTRIDRSIVPTGEIPEPLEDFLEAASAAVAAIPQEVADGVAEGFGAVTAEAETLAAGSDATAEFNTETKVLTIGVPVGADGQDGDPGADGFSPVASVSKSGDTATISITDKNGTTTAEITDGQDGQPGDDGYSPTAIVTKTGSVATITLIDKHGTTSAQISDGTPGDPTQLIDDTSTTATNRTWSVSKLNNQIDAKQDAPANGAAAGKVLGLALVDGQLVPVWDGFPVSDVQVNGTSILSQGVANVPVANSTDYGVAKEASGNDIKAGSATKFLTAKNQFRSVFYGLAEAAGASMASVSGATVGVYPEAQKIAIQKMLGIYESPWELIREDTVTNATEDAHDITVDRNGNAFELTDVRMWMTYPSQENESKWNGFISLFDGETTVKQVPMDAFTHASDASSCAANFSVTQEHGMILLMSTSWSNSSVLSNIRWVAHGTSTDSRQPFTLSPEVSFTKIRLQSVKGTMTYRLYGKRKWN